jgi:hypothetical protein
MFRSLRLLSISLLLFLLVCQDAAFARPRVILMAVDSLAWEDVTYDSLVNIRRLEEKAAWGLMNVRTGGRLIPEDGHTSLGASARAVGAKEAGLAFHLNDTYEGMSVRHIYQGRTGLVPPTDGIVNLSVVKTIRENNLLPQKIHVGALGDAIEGAGRRRAVLGNSDVGKTPRRFAVSIAMDSKGYVDMGRLDLKIVDPLSPQGIRTDVEGLLEEISRFLNDADFIVVEFGDLLRLEEEASLLRDDMVRQHRLRALKDLDQLLGGILSMLEPDDVVILLGSTPSGLIGRKGSQLTPVIIAGHKIESGLLIGHGTRWDGLIINTSIAPTILKYLNMEPPVYINAMPVEVVSSDDPIGVLGDMDTRVGRVNANRSLLLRTYILIAIILHLGSLLLILVPGSITAFLTPIFQRGIIFLISLPLALLLLPLSIPEGFSLALLISVVFAIAIALIASLAGSLLGANRGLAIMVIVMLGTAITLMIDIATGYNLIRYSPLGYDAVTGARFYGIGNEYMGILVGASLVGTFGLLELLSPHQGMRRIILGVTSLAIIGSIGHPSLGANAGGTITAASGFGLSWLLLETSSIGLWHIVGLGIGIIVTIFAIAILDYLRGSTSHMGGAIKLFLTFGIGEIYNIIRRKVAMNMKLFRWSPWSRALVVALGALVLLFYRPTDLLRRIVKRYPILSKGILATIIASIVAAIVNDSGVVAAATCILFASSTLLTLALEDKMRVK